MGLNVHDGAGPARALILAAGRGERMRPLTDHCPKPLLPVRGQPLLQWWLDALARGGVRDVVVNTAWLGDQIESYFGLQRPPDGRSQLSNNELSVRCSSEGRDFGYALETAGGIARALPLLAPQPHDVFWVMAGDIFAPDFVISADAVQRFAASGLLAHLWLVPNPRQHAQPRFAIARDTVKISARIDQPLQRVQQMGVAQHIVAVHRIDQGGIPLPAVVQIRTRADQPLRAGQVACAQGGAQGRLRQAVA